LSCWSHERGSGTQFSIYLPGVQYSVAAPAQEEQSPLPEGHGERTVKVAGTFS
jgi:hypothetical protein